MDWIADRRSNRTTLVAVTGSCLLVASVVGGLIPLVIPLVVGAAFLMALRPGLGLGVLVFVLYSRLSDALIGSVGAPSIVEPLIALLVIVALVRRFEQQEEWGDWRTPATFLGAYLVLGLASVLHASAPDRTLPALVDVVKDGFIVVLVAVLLTTTQRLRIAVWGVLLAGGLLAALSVLQYLTGSFETTYYGLAQSDIENIIGDVDDSRSGGPGLGPNGFAQILLFVVPLALERAWHERRRFVRFVAGATAGLAMAAVVLTFSRQAIIAAAAMGAVAVYYHREYLTRVLLVVTAALVLLLVVAPPNYTDRIGSLSELASLDTTAEDPSFEGRLSEYIVGVQMFVDRPVTGVGLANYKPLYQSYSEPLGLDSRRTERSPHSLYLQFAAELGIGGIMWLLALNAVAFAGLRHGRAWARDSGNPELWAMALALEVSLIGYLVTSLFRHMAFPRYFWLIYGLVLAVPHIAARTTAARARSKVLTLS